ncbi:gamma-glutamylaminecyclotransferase isoform X1 [Vicugna pacos]|uniref:Gamma-glutamylaminecyclotransferase n=2 Tax=Vicugna pacos TaxID=30538 RepID=A0ABM5EHG8_VICPA
MKFCSMCVTSKMGYFIQRMSLGFIHSGSFLTVEQFSISQTYHSFSSRMAHVFVYGTLKTGQPNHKVLLDGAHGRAALRGRGRTVQPYPLVIAGEHNIPRLLNLPGRGNRVAGEIYAVDEQMLHFLDEFEGCPDMYQRTLVTIAVEGAGGTLQCFVYSTATYPPEWVHLPYHDDYDSQGEHGLRYNPRENR